MTRAYYSLNEISPPGFQKKIPGKNELKNKTVALFADSLDHAISSMGTSYNALRGIIITKDKQTSISPIRPNLWHIKTNIEDINFLYSIASLILDLIEDKTEINLHNKNTIDNLGDIKQKMEMLRNELNNQKEKLQSQNQQIEKALQDRMKSKATLETLEKKYSVIVSLMSDIIFIIDGDDRFVDVDCKTESPLYIPPNQFLGKKHQEVLPPYMNELYEIASKTLRKTGNPQSYNYQIEINNEIKHFSAYLSLYKDDGSIIVGVREITEQKKFEEALKASNERVKKTFNAISDAVFLHPHMDEGFAPFVEVNDTACTRYGYTREEFLKLKGPDITLRSDAEKHSAKEHRKMLLEEKNMIFTSTHITKSGKHIPVELNSTIIELDGQPMILAVARDITERKRMEDALRKNELLLKETQRISKIGGWEFDIEKQITTWTEETYRIHEIDQDMTTSDSQDLIQMSLDCFSEKDKEMVFNAFTRCISKGEPYHFELPFTTRKGNKLWIRTSGQAIKEGKRTVKILGNIMDITEKHRLEEEKARLEEEYHQAQKVESIGRLAGGVSHDLNNLLSPIIGYGELLLESLPPQDSKANQINQMVIAGYKARDLVRQLLAFSRKQTLEYRNIDINQTLTEFVKLLRRTIREDIEIEIIINNEELIIEADVGQIEQVIMNLAVNSQYAMPEGGKFIIKTSSFIFDDQITSHHSKLKKGKYVVLDISDSGIGMDDETIAQIFEPFYTTKGEEGTGLGLSTVYGIVKQHDGEIWVYSEPGLGTTFKIYLPMSEGPVQTDNLLTSQKENLNGSGTILIVEDDEQVRELCNSILQSYGYKIILARNGQEALETLRTSKNKIDILLTDVVLPAINGKELYKKASNRFPDLKVLYMSGYHDNVIAHHGILEEGINFIQKPFTPQALALKVKEVLHQKN